MFGPFLTKRLKSFEPVEVSPGHFALQSGSWQYAAAMRTYEWGRPRGYLIQWRTTTNKPHLYRCAKGDDR